ncbi:MAG TPA: aldehyde dehydrogenase family protein, partial [Alicyclobacillus sp.]|nr:aldehyde dehydrogenase family protein [Alicyclobacillus sp.]
MEIYRMWIGGEWVQGEAGEEKVILDPATGQEVAKVPEATPGDVNRAVEAARASFERGTWADAAPGERAAVLLKAADLLEQQAQEYAELETRQTGKPLKLSAYSDIPAAIDNIRFFAGLARHIEGKATGEYLPGYTSAIRRDPVGVVASIAPWNYPLLMAIWKLMPALAAGNSVVIKP